MSPDRRALLLIDLQNDYLARDDLVPPRAALLERVAELLSRCRSNGVPVAHIHTRVAADGSDRMPHQRANDIWCCIAGTPGADAPEAAFPLEDEPLFTKTVFDPFSNPRLADWLRGTGVEHVLVAGAHTHACVRETALGAYQRGFRVTVVDDAVTSYDPLHAELTRRHLDARAMRFVPVAALFSQDSPEQDAPAARIGARCVTAPTCWIHRNPARLSEIVTRIARADASTMDAAVQRANDAQLAWAALPPAARGAVLSRIADAIERKSDALADMLVRNIGKPLTEARAEVERAIELVHIAVRLFCGAENWHACDRDVHVRRVALGTVAAITPFNHALGIAIGKLAPALALGNAVVWKPSPYGAMVAERILDTLADTGLPMDLVTLVHGDGATALQLARHPDIAAVSVTASETAGRQLAFVCAADFKPLQAELGGNNAVVVASDADIEAIAGDCARAAFGFAGQRCTAGRRILVAREREAELIDALALATRALVVGEPTDERTEVGPLIDVRARDRVDAIVKRARAEGAGVVCGGAIPDGFEHGAWYAPTLLRGVSPQSAVFLEESFGPIATITPFDSVDEVLALVNAVPQGLIATLYGGCAALRRRFLDAAKAGVLKFDCMPSGVNAEAPFGGWKNSGFGPPEHGRWDADFYTRTQAVYGNAPRRD